MDADVTELEEKLGTEKDYLFFTQNLRVIRPNSPFLTSEKHNKTTLNRFENGNLF